MKELDARLQVQRKEVLKRSEECQKLLAEIAEKTASAREMEGEAIEKKKSLDIKQAEITVKKVIVSLRTNQMHKFLSVREKLILN